MKLCQKCADEIRVYARRGYNLGRGDQNASEVAKTPIDLLLPKLESECEFWAHKELNNHLAFPRVAASL